MGQGGQGLRRVSCLSTFSYLGFCVGVLFFPPAVHSFYSVIQDSISYHNAPELTSEKRQRSGH